MTEESYPAGKSYMTAREKEEWKRKKAEEKAAQEAEKEVSEARDKEIGYM